MSFVQQFFIKSGNNSFIGTIENIDTNTNELQIKVNRILEGTIIDNYDETLSINEVGTFTSPFWRFYKIIGETVNPNVLAKIDTQYGLNEAMGIDKKYLPGDTKIYNNLGIFIGLLKDIGMPGSPRIYLKYLENNKTIRDEIGDLRDSNFSIYYNPTTREHIKNANLPERNTFAKLPEDIQREIGNYGGKKTKRKWRNNKRRKQRKSKRTR